MGFTSEVYLTKKNVTKEEWHEFIINVSNYNGILKKWKMNITFKNNTVHYFIETKCHLPSSINNLQAFILKSCIYPKRIKKIIEFPYIGKIGCNAIDIYNYVNFKNRKLLSIELIFKKIYEDKIISNIKFNVLENNKIKKYRLILGIPSSILSINFESNYNMFYKNAPKYLDISKSLHLLKSNKVNSILQVDTFPYLEGEYYLDQQSIDFAKHSIVFGSSGSGKSKFLSLLINNIYQNDLFKRKYKFVVIDPHASLENDIGGLGCVIDFKSSTDAIDLFYSDRDDVVVTTQLLIDVFKGLLPNNYNSKLERVLRHSLYLLIIANNFNFKSLRKLFLDLEYRNSLIKKNSDKLLDSIKEFFLSEFNDIKTKSYTEAISPIIALIDEMEMIPVFNRDDIKNNLKDTINNNFLTIFSLDQTKLGEKVTKTIAGLVMQQLLLLVQNYSFEEHIIFVIDEVPVIENSILNRYLRESRKYNLSLVLAGQYFSGISDGLKKAIFANVINYYIFRVSKDDAITLVDNFNMKIPLNNTKEEKIKMLTEQQDRECLIRISSNGLLLPAIKCRTLNFVSIPRLKKKEVIVEKENSKNTFKDFKYSTNINLKDVLLANSTGRRD